MIMFVLDLGTVMICRFSRPGIVIHQEDRSQLVDSWKSKRSPSKFAKGIVA